MQSSRSRLSFLLAGGLLLGVCLILLGTVPSFARPATVEPPLEFQLQVDDQRVPVELDRAFTVTIDGAPVRMRLTVAADRLFDNSSGLRFRYPKDMVFHYEASTPTTDSWTLTGNDCTLMLYRFRGVGVGADEMREIVLEEMISAYGRANVRLSRANLVLAGRTLNGSRLVASISGEKIQQDLVAFLHGKDVFLLVVQDSPTDSGELSAETRSTVALLSRTFKFPE